MYNSGKRSKIMNEMKPFKNTNKNPQNFHRLKWEDPPTPKLQDHVQRTLFKLKITLHREITQVN